MYLFDVGCRIDKLELVGNLCVYVINVADLYPLFCILDGECYFSMQQYG
jgi:hypothetical protein